MKVYTALLPGLLAAVGTAAASTLGVAPVRIELKASATIAVLTVRNQEDSPVVVQARPAAWSQHDDHDQLDETHELLVTPPLFTIPPKGEQVLRVALLRKPDPTRELDYRVVLSEVPPPPDPDSHELRVALRITLPVFVAAPLHTAPDLTWSHTRLPDGTLRISAQNHGTQHVQILDFDVASADHAEQKLHTNNARYLLPGGGSAHWELPAAPGVAPGTRLLIHGHSDAGDFSVTSEPGAP
jgi:fimbrial chaperone protein